MIKLPSTPAAIYTILGHIIKDSWAEQVLYVGCNALEAAKSHSKQREQPQLDLQTICLDINITTPSQYMERLVGILRE
jgi:hypothetical protein